VGRLSNAGQHQTATSSPERRSKLSSGSSSNTADPSTEPILDSDSTVTPLGKLKVRIIEARNLSAKSDASWPYVVCTFDTSEYITQGPEGGSGTGGDDHQYQNHPTGIAIPRSRQSSSLALSKLASQATHGSQRGSALNPQWKDEAIFDVTSKQSVLQISIYDTRNNDAFLGHASIQPDFGEKRVVDRWLKLEPRVEGERVSGEVRVSLFFEKVSKRVYGPDDFEVLRLVGRGTFGQVYQVRKNDTKRIYAMKVLSKKTIVQKKEIAHTIGERNILVRTSSAESNFIVGLKFSFQTPTDLYLVTDYMSGGELFWHLQKEGRFDEQRAKFYIAELIIALEHLHDNDIVYRDLKPENILLDANGHVALCDFGLSKANLDEGTTNTFCGTTEYLAPEVLLDDQGYTKMVDFWSLGVLVFEMCCGWSPFYAEDNQQMYKNIAFGKVRFPKDALSQDGRNFVKGLLNRNPKHRLGSVGDARELRAHPFFNDVEWDLLIAKKIPPPFKPQVSSETDTSNFDPEFTQTSSSLLHKQFNMSSTPLSPGIQANFQGFTYVDDSFEENYKNLRGAALGSSYRPRSYIQQDGDIDLYDDNEIKMSQSYYSRIGGPASTSGKIKRRPEEDDDGDIGMDDDDDDDHDFVSGQQFEM
jgi:serine/threonine protein kinase SCH9